jgi:tetratricopeptide (TPR) repeat protein
MLCCAMLIAGLVPALARADEYSDAQKAVEEKDYVKALELIRVAIAKEPQDIDRLRLGAKVYLEMNILDTAAQYAKRVYKDDDDVKENVLLYANALIATNQAAEACVAIKKFRKSVDDVEMALAHVDALVSSWQRRLVRSSQRAPWHTLPWATCISTGSRVRSLKTPPITIVPHWILTTITLKLTLILPSVIGKCAIVRAMMHLPLSI